MCMQRKFNYVHIISAEDYPIKELDEILTKLKEDDKIYCDYSLIGSKKHYGYRRYAYYWIYTKYSMNYKKAWVRYFNLFLVGMQCVIPFWNKNHIGEFKNIYIGFVWGTYPKYAIKYIFDYMKEHKEFWSALITCKIPEELCFQTILLNSVYKDKVINNNLRYWTFEGGDGSGPVYLKMGDLDKMKSSEAFFARKLEFGTEIQKRLTKRLQGGEMNDI